MWLSGKCESSCADLVGAPCCSAFAQLPRLDCEVWPCLASGSVPLSYGSYRQLATVLCTADLRGKDDKDLQIACIVITMSHTSSALSFDFRFTLKRQTHSKQCLKACRNFWLYLRRHNLFVQKIITSVDSWWHSNLQGVCDDEVQSVIQVCSKRLSPWMLAHIPDLLLSRTSTHATLHRILPHLGCSQVRQKLLRQSIPPIWHVKRP